MKSINVKILCFILLACVLLTVSCDAVNRLSCMVENKTDQSIDLHVPSYPLDRNKAEYSRRVDTVLNIPPGEMVWLDFSAPDIDFPWATKNIYKVSPGICGIELVQNDTLIPIDCTSDRWKYKRKAAVLWLK